MNKINSGTPKMSAVSDSKSFVPLRSSIVGYVDYCDSQRVSGWLIDLADVVQHLHLKVLIDGVEVCKGVADEYRQDLAANPVFANTFHAYNLEISNVLSDGKEHEVKVIEAETGYVLKNSPIKVLFPKLSDKSNVPRLDLALVGKNGWLFLCNDSNDAIGQYAGRLKLTSEVLEQYVSQYRRTQSLYRHKGIYYLLTITPGKESIYSEFLPDSVTAGTGLTVKDQFIAAVNPVLDVDILDLKPVLLANKSRGQLCYKNDSHWNYLGAMIACQIIIEKLREKFTNIPEFDESAFTLINGDEGACDLSGKTRLNYIDGKYVENVEHLEQSVAVCAISVQNEKKAIELLEHPYKELSKTRPTRLFKNEKSANLPRAIIIRDSYADWMIPFLSEYFSECLFVWARYVEPAVIESFKPDIIIEQVVDRFLVVNRMAIQTNHLNTSVSFENPHGTGGLKPYLYGMSSYIPDALFLDADELSRQCGGNTGNVIFCHAISRMLDVDPASIPWGGDISHLSVTHDRLVIPMANFLGSHVDMSQLLDKFKKIHIPIVGIGLGGQGPITGIKLDSIPKGSWEWLEIMINKSATDKPNISLRGQATYDLIAAKGLADKCIVIGCPSNFINPSRVLGKSIYEKFKKSLGKTRRVAVTAGSVATQELKKLEQSLISLVEGSNGLYVCQAPIDMLRLYKQEYENISPLVFSRYKDYIHPEMDDDAFLQWFYRWSYAFTSAPEWLSTMARFDLVVGTRIHGVMAGIQAGTPSVCLCIDSRTLELCQTMMIPYVNANDYKEGISLEQIDEVLMQWDWQLFDANRRYLAEGYTKFLNNNGLQPANYLKLLAH
ncbi:polysaccharide pyruvyl transferase family protein [Methylobacter sp. YRD-M1]|uniref:polysaccharide pyruvyl transferase family protein n=1 Tax=Methylobacter sp. YRD-M1 TaxID=2911520 RepID=UPI00227CA86E|nr:polysaccharide pyruvyl transferase family protein [Methylobacter sp. YRD-M1]WAK00673.1 polysaccharide pyruvyl transferase family protein [Methylobacter sp. YRD-M1]